MDILTRDVDTQRASAQEARLWGTIGVVLVIGVLAVVGFAWKNDRLLLASVEAPAVRVIPAVPDLPPLP
jgi:hypothetical protein